MESRGRQDQAGGVTDLRCFNTEVRQTVGRELSDWEAEQTAARGFAPSAEEAEVWGDQAIVRAVEAASRRRLARGQAALSEPDEDSVIASVRSWVFGHGVLDSLLADSEIENIVANGYDNVTITKVGGVRVAGPPLADSEEEFEQLIRRWAATEGKTERRFDDSQPYLDLRLPDGSRLHAIKGVTSRLCVSIRKHRHLTITLDELVDAGHQVTECIRQGMDFRIVSLPLIRRIECPQIRGCYIDVPYRTGKTYNR